jgi:hypothetical protein
MIFQLPAHQAEVVFKDTMPTCSKPSMAPQTHHLTDPANVVVGTTDEANQVLDRILPQDPDSWEERCLSTEVGIQFGPLVIEFRQRDMQLEIIPYERFVLLHIQILLLYILFPFHCFAIRSLGCLSRQRIQRCGGFN